jgi:DNA-binding MarR family transcriptional regulator
VGIVTPVAPPGGSGPAEDARIPLARLFAIGYQSSVERLHQTLAARGWEDVRPNFGFVLLAARASGIQVTEIATLLGVTKQAASKLVDAMEQAGYVHRTGYPPDKRARLVALTRRGRQLLAVVEQIYAEIEADWAAVLGTRQLESMRADLTTVLRATHGGRLPVIRPP